MFKTVSFRPFFTISWIIYWSFFWNLTKFIEISDISKWTDCLWNQFLLLRILINWPLKCWRESFFWLIIFDTSLTTAILTTAILSPNCYSNLGTKMSTFSSCSNLFSIFWRRVSLFLQFFWVSNVSISLIWI